MNKKNNDPMDLEAELGAQGPVRLRRVVPGKVQSRSSRSKAAVRGRKRSTPNGGMHQRCNKKMKW